MTPQQFRDGVRIAVYLSVIVIYVIAVIIIIAAVDNMSTTQIVVSAITLSGIGYLIFTQL